MKKYPELYVSLAQIVQRQTSLQQPLILDIGSGSGLLAQAIQNIIPQATIIGIDPLPKMLQLAKENTSAETLQPILGVSEKIPLNGNVVDVIVSRFSIHYWNTPQDGIAEIWRVLKPGGKVVIDSLNSEFPSWKLFLIRLHMVFKFAGSDVIRYHLKAYNHAFTIEEIEQFLVDTGFIILEKQGKKKGWKFTVVAQKPIQ